MDATTERTRITSATNAEEAGARIARADTVLHNFRNGAAEREKLETVLAKLPEESRTLVRKNILPPTDSSIQELRKSTILATRGIVGAVTRHIEAKFASNEIIGTFDDAQCAALLRDVTALYNKYPEAFPLKMK